MSDERSSVQSAFIAGNPDFAPERDCPEARGACSPGQIIEAESLQYRNKKKELDEEKGESI